MRDHYLFERLNARRHIDAFGKDGNRLGCAPLFGDLSMAQIRRRARKWAASMSGAVTWQVRREHDFWLVVEGNV